jgi:hypothetical protein
LRCLSSGQSGSSSSGMSCCRMEWPGSSSSLREANSPVRELSFCRWSNSRTPQFANYLFAVCRIRRGHRGGNEGGELLGSLCPQGHCALASGPSAREPLSERAQCARLCSNCVRSPLFQLCPKGHLRARLSLASLPTVSERAPARAPLLGSLSCRALMWVLHVSTGHDERNDTRQRR